MARLFIAGACVVGVAAESLSDCGSPGDHLHIKSLVLDADATGGPKKGKPFTITAEATFDEAHTAGHLDIDLNIKALGVINLPLQGAAKYEFLPGLPKGDATLKIGPITVPTSIPGSFEITGTVKIQNDKAEPVMCMSYDLKIPAIIEDETGDLGAVDVADCTTPADHIQNIQFSTDASSITTTMDCDEDLSTVVVNGEISVKVPVVPAIKVTLPDVPVSWTPATPSGQFKFVVGYAEGFQRNGLFDISGQVKLSDGNSEQLTCIAFDLPIDSRTSDLVTV